MRKFDEGVRIEFCQAIEKFKAENPEYSFYKLQLPVSKISDSLILFGSWMYDFLNGKSGQPNTPTYRGSLTKKVRKAIGYNI